jgi:hypothetical protein
MSGEEVFFSRHLTLQFFKANFEKLIAFAIESKLSSTQSKLFEKQFSSRKKNFFA